MMQTLQEVIDNEISVSIYYKNPNDKITFHRDFVGREEQLLCDY